MLKLTRDERNLLLSILEEQVKPLSVEINRTDGHDYKVGLLQRSRLLDGLIDKVKSHATEPECAAEIGRA